MQHLTAFEIFAADEKASFFPPLIGNEQGIPNTNLQMFSPRGGGICTGMYCISIQLFGDWECQERVMNGNVTEFDEFTGSNDRTLLSIQQCGRRGEADFWSVESGTE